MNEDKRYKIVNQDLQQFLSLVKGYTFTLEQLYKQFNYTTREAKNNCWHVLEYLVKKGELEKIATGKYRHFDPTLEEIHWRNANVEDIVKVNLPLSLDRYVKIYHKSINIIAGAPGAGKTAFLYDFLLRNMNMNDYPLILFTNDMTAEEIKERMLNAEIEIPNPSPFKVYDRADNFADVVEPDAINVIDYLDLNSEVYLIGDEIEKIYRKLKRGIAWIGIQKKPGQEIGQGGVFSIKRAKLYLSLDQMKENEQWIHKLIILKARGRVIPSVNPRQLQVRFKLVDGIKFVNVRITGTTVGLYDV